MNDGWVMHYRQINGINEPQIDYDEDTYCYWLSIPFYNKVRNDYFIAIAPYGEPMIVVMRVRGMDIMEWWVYCSRRCVKWNDLSANNKIKIIREFYRRNLNRLEGITLWANEPSLEVLVALELS